MHDATTLTGLIRIVHRLLRDLERRDLAYLGLGPGQARIVRELAGSPGLTADDLRRRFRLDRSTVSVALRKLVAAGYLRSEPHPRDRRTRAHTTTRFGMSIATEALGVERDQESFLSQGLDEEDRDSLRRHLIDLASNLSHELRHPGRPRAIFPADRNPFPGPNQGSAP